MVELLPSLLHDSDVLPLAPRLSHATYTYITFVNCMQSYNKEGVAYILILIYVGDATLTSSDQRPCPDDIVVFTCNVSGVDLTWRVTSSEGVAVAQFFIDDRSMANVPEEMSGFLATLVSRTPNTDSSSTLTTPASVQINGYTVMCADAAMEIGRKTIQLSSEFKIMESMIIITNTCSLTFILMDFLTFL